MRYKVSVHIEDKTEILMCPEGVSLYNILLQYGFAVSAPCGGNGKCGKCLLPVYGAFRKPYGEISRKEKIPVCKAYPCGDCSVWISDFSDKIPVVNFPETKYDGNLLGIAFDVGTTSICATLCDMATGEELKTVTCKNKQSSFGADIMSRLSHDHKKLSDILISQINEIITHLYPKKSQISRIVFAANTVMSHYITGLTTDGLKTFPFVSADTFGKEYDAEALGIKCKNATVFIAPSLGSFVGGDIASGIVATGMAKSKKLSLLLDIGTNGEMALGSSSGILAASAAAGPAFEGAELACGMGAISGAIVSYDGKTYKTVDNKSAVGISGSGAIDLVAELLNVGIIDRGGRMLPPDESPTVTDKLCVVNGEVVFRLSEDVYLSAGDVRKLQLAKSAIRAALHALMKEAGVCEKDIDVVYLSGAFGTNIKKENAAAIGLIPNELLYKCVPCGNTSLQGAKLMLLSSYYRKEAVNVTDITRHIELSDNDVFSDAFVSFLPMY